MRKSLFSHALFAFVASLFLIFGQAVKAQSALDGFDPYANGTIRTTVDQPDGKILIGGFFTTLSPNGSGLRNARVVLTDANGSTRTALTGSFGYFRFDSVQAGETYVVSVVSKRYRFSPRVVTLDEELSELNFTAQP